MKRVLVASMMHESNSFNPIIAGENDFGVVRKNFLREIQKMIRCAGSGYASGTRI